MPPSHCLGLPPLRGSVFSMQLSSGETCPSCRYLQGWITQREQLSAQILCCADTVAWLSVLRIVTSAWCCLLFHWSDARLGRGHMVNFAWRYQSSTALLSFCVPWEGSALAEGQLGTETLEKISSEEDPKFLTYFEKWCIHVPTLSQWEIDVWVKWLTKDMQQVCGRAGINFCLVFYWLSQQVFCSHWCSSCCTKQLKQSFEVIFKTVKCRCLLKEIKLCQQALYPKSYIQVVMSPIE